MAAKGADEKLAITNTILSTFEGSFLYNDGKEIRIPMGEVQIKVALTCAKENVSPDGEFSPVGVVAESNGFPAPATAHAEPTQEELDRVADLMKKLNL